MNEQKMLLLQTLENLGWIINLEKSSLNPETSKEYIGYKITTEGQPLLKIPNTRIRKLKRSLVGVLQKTHATAPITGANSRSMYRNDESNYPRKVASEKLVQTHCEETNLGRLIRNRSSDASRSNLVERSGPHLERYPNHSRAHRLPDRDRCVRKRLGCSPGRSNRSRILECQTVAKTLQLQRDDGNLAGPENVQEHSRQICTSFNRQHQRSGVYQPPRWSKQRIDTISKRNMDRSTQPVNDSDRETLSRGEQCRSGSTVTPVRQVRVEVAPASVRLHRQIVGPPHHRSLRNTRQCAAARIQQPVRRAVYNGRGCISADRLGGKQQFCKRPISTDSANLGSCANAKSSGDYNCPPMASATMVSASSESFDLPTPKAAKTQCVPPPQNKTRTTQKQEVGDICLESIWAKNLSASGWTQRTVAQLPLCLAPSTLYSYNRVIKQFASYCCIQNVPFPPPNTSVVAGFLCSIADRSEAPRSQLKIAGAALGHVYKSYGIFSVINNEHVQLLITSLIKSATNKPMAKSLVMPVQPFRDMFLGWPSNDLLSIKNLRLKTITLLALTLMLRPSDIAPKAVHFDAQTLQQKSWLFTTDNITFLDSGEAKIIFHGIKNDTSRSGFDVILQPVQERQLDPVQTLHDYIS